MVLNLQNVISPKLFIQPFNVCYLPKLLVFFEFQSVHTWSYGGGNSGSHIAFTLH